MSLRKSLIAAVALSLATTGCAISFPDYPLGAGGSSSGSMSTGALMVTACVPAACDPDALSTDAAIDPMCGVFVSPGANGGDGSRGAPYGSLATALMNDASQRPIYVCATPSGVNEAVTLTGAIDLYGGFDCTSWKKSGMKTPWTAPANSVPLRITNSGFKECDGAFVDGFAIKANDATGADPMTRNGNSSIGAFVSGGFGTFVNVDIIAGNGADGIAGTKMPPRAKGADSDSTFNGQSGLVCSAGAGPTGAPPATESCGGENVSGGKGGDGGQASGLKGGDGQGMVNTVVPGFGDGGLGQPSISMNCHDGTAGADGLDGTVVGGGTTLGTLDANGFEGANGEDGKDGESGGGGGGGGGGIGNGQGSCGPGVAGSGGGGGGAGGCGGKGGAGGGAGGASIALASFGANVALKNVTLQAKQGGKGADGGDGQQGGTGGSPGPGACVATACCSGGAGGKGGSGTGGGGGKGGSSFGIAFHGDMAPVIPETAIIVSLSKATGGMGGMATIGPSTAGDPGDNVKIQAFP